MNNDFYSSSESESESDCEVISKQQIGCNRIRFYYLGDNFETYCDTMITIDYKLYDDNTGWYFIFLEFSYDESNSNSLKANPLYDSAYFSLEFRDKLTIVNQKNNLTTEIVNYLLKNNDELENIFDVAVPELYSKPLVFALPICLFPAPVPIVNDPLLDVATSVMANVSKGVTPVAFAISGEL